MDNNSNIIPVNAGIEVHGGMDSRLRGNDSSISRNFLMIDHYRKFQLVFAFLFLLGSLVAPIGWYAEWKDVEPISHYATIITIVGHALQVIGAFGSLVTPDYVEEDEE